MVNVRPYDREMGQVMELGEALSNFITGKKWILGGQFTELGEALSNSIAGKK